jgi:putative transposase
LLGVPRGPGNDPALCGRRIELHYDPDDLRRIDLWFDSRPAGVAVPFAVGRHVQPHEVPVAPDLVASTGIDYLDLVERDHLREQGGSPQPCQR